MGEGREGGEVLLYPPVNWRAIFILSLPFDRSTLLAAVSTSNRKLRATSSVEWRDEQRNTEMSGMVFFKDGNPPVEREAGAVAAALVDLALENPVNPGHTKRLHFVSNAGPNPEFVRWDSPTLQHVLSPVGFDRVFFRDRPCRWCKPI